ncbi:hypothetical protein [Micromonospora sp. NPDC048830]|uniref:hypothetical protein n=1 Tax=Micromonospora sp. NPDC048830 TaxID=3364257 RepID=UPI0037224F12
MSELKSAGKSFEISKREVWEAWEKVRANKGAAGVDGCSVGDFEADLKNNLYRVWTRRRVFSGVPPVFDTAVGPHLGVCSSRRLRCASRGWCR